MVKARKEKMPPEEIKKERILNPFTTLLFLFVGVAMSLYHIYSAGIEMLPQPQNKAIHLSFALFLIFLLYPLSPTKKMRLPFYDYIFMAVSIAIASYFLIDYQNIVFRVGSPNKLDIGLGIATIFLVLEATRRTMGWALVIVALVALLYAFLGHLIPGIMGHRPYSISRIVGHMFMTGEGIYGVSIYVTATFVFMFILLGSILSTTGASQIFIDLAFSLTGKYRGGPAKAAIVASGLMGTISGSALANVGGTGTFTIPLMKRVGYKPSFAGGVEAAASTGGQLMPPIMGAAAFIMAEFIGISYQKLIIHALIPAIMYYIAIFLMVDFQAAKIGLKGLEKDEIPQFWPLVKKGGFLLCIPLSIFVMLFIGYSAIKASLIAVLAAILVSYLTPQTRLTVKQLFLALANGAKSSLSVIAACAVAGLIVGTVTLTGIGLKFADLILQISVNNVYLALIFTMVACIFLSMGMPTTALYIILASVIAPALVTLGIPVVAAHLFIFYYGCMATVTPPVALSSYLAASIAKADPTETALKGLKLTLSAFILPFVFALSPEFILVDTTIFIAIKIWITAIIGIFLMASSLEGYFLGDIKKVEQWILFACAMALIVPEIISDVLGIVFPLFILLIRFIRLKKEAK